MRRFIAKIALIGAAITWVWFFVLLAEGRALTTQSGVELSTGTSKRAFAMLQASERAGDNAESAFWLALSLSGVAWLGRR